MVLGGDDLVQLGKLAAGGRVSCPGWLYELPFLRTFRKVHPSCLFVVLLLESGWSWAVLRASNALVAWTDKHLDVPDFVRANNDVRNQPSVPTSMWLGLI